MANARTPTRSTTEQKAKDLRARVWESDLLDWRGWRVNFFQDWKARLKLVDLLYQGAWSEVFSDESVMRENPHVMNLVQVGLDDIAKLVSEAVASVRCLPEKNTETAGQEANIREAIADTYWEMNKGEMLVPRLAMDVAGAGCAFVVVAADDTSDYPCLYRVDPRHAYPDVRNGQLQNLLVVEVMNARIAASMFPQLNLDDDPTLLNRTVELLHYYSPGKCVQALSYNRTPGANPDTAIVTREWEPMDINGKPIMPVGFVQLDSFDGSFRGMFDQISGSLQTKNRIVKQLLDYTDEVVYAERFSKGLLNPEEPPGPMAHFRLDPNVPDSAVGRVAPAASAPQVFQILEYLDREQRGAAGYPSARQGEISQSIASASFVASTQGQLTSTVRNVQRLLANLRTQLNTISFGLDESYLDVEKPLVRAVGRKQTYTPRKDIAGVYRNQVLYGAAAGLDRLNADVRILQLLGAGILSKEDAREQIDFISDPRAVAGRVDYEQTQSALLQKFLAEAPVELLMKMLAAESEGKTLPEAVKLILAEQEAAAAAPPAVPGMGAPAAAPGGAPSATPTQAPQFAPPPLEQIGVNQPVARPGVLQRPGGGTL